MNIETRTRRTAYDSVEGKSITTPDARYLIRQELGVYELERFDDATNAATDAVWSQLVTKADNEGR